MRTAIGQHLKSSPSELTVAGILGVLVVAADLALVCWNHYPVSIEGRGVLAIVVLAVYFRLVNGDLACVGLRFTPTQGWKYWVEVSLLIGLVVLAFIVVGLGGWVLTGGEVPIYITSPSDLGTSFMQMCLFAPVQEEVIYRLALCVPLVVWLGPWGAIVVSGLAFAGLHFAYGNPSPNNLVGGFFLAWVYLKSESIALPVLLHSLGNLFALAGQIGAWYWFGGTV